MSNKKKRSTAIILIAVLIVGIFGGLVFGGGIKAPEKVMLEYYVSTTGDDGADGSKNAPFATLERARDEVRKHTDNMTGNIIVHIAEGVYTLNETLTFD